MANQRNTYIDFLRFIGMSLVILAHVNAPIMVHQVRCFDVPLMVFVSGLSYSGKNIKPSFRNYFLPRILRLTVPVYVFITVYFIICALLGKAQSITTVLGTYCLLTSPSIGYVWIIKVFILMMLITPMLLKLSRYINHWYTFIFLALTLLIEDVICQNVVPNINLPLLKLAFSETIPYIIGYSAIFMLGLNMRNVSSKEGISTIVILTVMAIVIFFIQLFSGKSLNLQAYKYPPQAYFLIYGMLVSCILWSMRNFKPLIKVSLNKLVIFIGSNTIWIYLWHICYVIFANKYLAHWCSRYIFVYLFSVLCFIIQYKIVQKLRVKYNLSFLKYFVG